MKPTKPVPRPNREKAPRVRSAAVAGAVARKRAEAWLAENREALESSNAFVEAHGLPLGRIRARPH
jgi:post-segregation antitoxin (ccd killing protein)